MVAQRGVISCEGLSYFSQFRIIASPPSLLLPHPSTFELRFGVAQKPVALPEVPLPVVLESAHDDFTQLSGVLNAAESHMHP